MLTMLVILSTAIGTVTGVIATVLLMQRKGQYLATGADLVARQQLPEMERALANATATVEELRNQVAAQGQVLQQNREDLERKQQEIDAEFSRRTMAEQQVGPLSERVRELTAQVEDEKRQKDELAGWNVTLTAQAGQQGGAVADQLKEIEAKAAAERQAVATELEAAKREKEELAGQLRAVEAKAEAERQTVAAELEAARRDKEQLAGQVRDLEALAAERQVVSTDIDGVRSEKEALVRQLRELEAKAAEQRLAVWAELDSVRRENESLSGQLRDLQAKAAAELEAERRQKEDWAQRHAALSAEVGTQAAAASQQLRILEAKAADERLRLATELDAERQRKEALEAEVERDRSSAAEVMELLSLAHKKFSGVFEMRFTEGRNGNSGSNGDNLPMPALALAAEDDAVFEFANGDSRAVSELAGD